MKKAVLAIILLMAVSVILISCNGVSVGINFYVDGELYDGISTEGGETIEMPDNPEKEGYVFQGWFWEFRIQKHSRAGIEWMPDARKQTCEGLPHWDASHLCRR